MNKEIMIVYQDCFTCGSKQKWGEKTINAIIKAGIPYRKVSFACAEGQAHCMKAIQNGITSFPFVTDGSRYAKDIDSLLNAKKSEKRTRKTKKGVKNGPVSES